MNWVEILCTVSVGANVLLIVSHAMNRYAYNFLVDEHNVLADRLDEERERGYNYRERIKRAAVS